MMKIYIISFLLSFATYSIFAQFNPSGCGSLSPGIINSSFPNNISVRNFSFDKRYLACEDITAGGYAGFIFTAMYSVSDLSGIKDIFTLRIGTNSLMKFRFNNNKIEIVRDVIYRPCNSWSNGQCQSFGSIVKGSMIFGTWDDNFIESLVGWLIIKVVDNGMEIEVTNSENANGYYKTEFNYEGLHLSGVDQQLEDDSNYNANIYVFSESSGVTLSNIDFLAGTFPPVSAVIINNNYISPNTNFPTSSSKYSKFKELQSIEVSQEMDINSDLKLYPNPSENGNFSIEFELKKPGFAGFKIVNIAGQIVYNLEPKNLGTGNHKFEFKKENTKLASGFYLVNVETKEFSKKLKLVVK